jgi:hypothetical protein
MFTLTVKKIFIMSLLMTSVSHASFFKEGNGRKTSKTFVAATQIAGLSTSGNYNVIVKSGSENSARVTIDENLVDHISVSEKGQEWHIELSGRLEPSFKPEIEMTLKDLSLLRAVKAHGSVRIALPNMKVDQDLLFSSTGLSSIEALDIVAENIILKATGGSRIELGGKVKTCSLQANGATAVNLQKIVGQNLQLKANGSNTIYLGKFDGVSSDLNGLNNIIGQR